MNYSITKLSWNNIINDVLELSSKIQDIDVIITIGRGGNIPGTMLGYKIGTKSIINFGVQSYNDDKTVTDIQIQQEPNLKLLKDKKVLVVDDLADKGTTLEYVKKYLQYNRIDSKFCTLYVKEGTKFKPEFYTKIFKSDEWIEFPWDDLSSKRV